MKTSIKDYVAVLDHESEKQVAEAREQLLKRLGKRITTLNLRIDVVSRDGSTTCEVVVHTANHLQIFARHRDRDALTAALTALERARVQVRRVLRISRYIPPRSLATAAS